MTVRSSNSVMHETERLLLRHYASSGVKGFPATVAIGTVPGSSLCLTDAMGVGGVDCTVTICPSEACTLTCWIWDRLYKRWVFNGANYSRYSLSFEAYGTDTFEIDEGQPWLLTSTVPVDNCSTDSPIHNPS